MKVTAVYFSPTGNTKKSVEAMAGALDPNFTVIDVTAPVTLQVSDAAGTTVTYTLNVVRATTASGDAVSIKSSTFQGFPASATLLDWDMAYFQDKFYAIVTSLDGTTENYQLFSSVDGVNWTEVAYQVSTAGVSLPDTIDGYVIGGEGARLAVLNDRMYVLGGARTQAADRFGEAAELDWGMAAITAWRSASTSDGMTFEADTIGGTYALNGEMTSLSNLKGAYLNAVTFNDALYIKGGYAPAFYGTWQGVRMYVRTSDGKNWTNINAVSSSVSIECDVQNRNGDAFFAFKGKLWCVGGFNSFPSASNMRTSIWSSEDGENWTLEDDGTNAAAV